MSDTPKVDDLAAHAARISKRRERLREHMAQLAAEHANPVPLTPESPAAP